MCSVTWSRLGGHGQFHIRCLNQLETWQWRHHNELRRADVKVPTFPPLFWPAFWLDSSHVSPCSADQREDVSSLEIPHEPPPQPPIPVRARKKTNKMAESEERRAALLLAGGEESSSSLVRRISVLDSRPGPRVWVIHRNRTDRSTIADRNKQKFCFEQTFNNSVLKMSPNL